MSRDSRKQKKGQAKIDNPGLLDLDKTTKTSGSTSRTSSSTTDSSPGKASGKKAAPGAAQASGKALAQRGRNVPTNVVMYFFFAVFIGMIIYFVWFMVFRANSFINNSYNTARMDLYAEHVKRGSIVSSDGVTLAYTDTDEDGAETRVYPYDDMFSHSVGYIGIGRSGLEEDYNYYLLSSNTFILTKIYNNINGIKSDGDTLVSTLSFDVQQAAYDALGSRKGAVVVMEVETGKIIAMVSKPSFDANTVVEDWDYISTDTENSPLVNRVSSGIYPPGSIFKVLTTLEYMDENADYESFSYYCTGSAEIDGYTINCYHGTAHGEQSLKDAFAYSCNAAYANIGTTLDIGKFSDLCESMYFNKTLPGNVSGAESSFTLTPDTDEAHVATTSIGQGDTGVTPLHMCVIAAAIANGGKAMTPTLYDHMENVNGITSHSYWESSAGNILSSSQAEIMQEYMEAVVEYGTATALSGQSYAAAGKTGSAEYNEDGDSHGWFIGYGEKEGYEDIAIAVIVEDGGSGSTSAVPVAKDVFDVYFNL